MNKESHTSFGVMWGGDNLAVGMGSDFDLRDLLKPRLSPALPHWKPTRVLGGQLDHNITIASMLTFHASLITSITPHWKRTRVSSQACLHTLLSKARLRRRFWLRQLDAIFVANKLQLQNRTCKPGVIFSAICCRDIAGVSNMFETWCNFRATKIASSCRDKNRLCERA